MTDTEGNDILCISCSKTDLKALLEPYEWIDEDIDDREVENFRSWGKKVDIGSRDEDQVLCSFCRVFKHVSSRFENVHNIGPELVFWPNEPLTLWTIPEFWLYEPRHLPPANVSKFGYRVLLVQDPKNDEITALGRVVKPIGINFQAIQSWLQSCHDIHSCDGRLSGIDIPGMELIDCLTRVIVPATLGMKYVALSYVWGKPKVERLEPDPYPELPETLPLVVEDAIKVVLGIGRQYLWIDRYCIRQDDPVKKQDQIMKMHLIYGKAEMTIVAMSGSEPDDGLAGVSEAKREQQFSCRVNGETYVNLLGQPDHYVNGSVTEWKKRGWTFQEIYLSRRRLVFSNQQCYFECAEMLGLESSTTPLQHPFRWESMKDLGPSYPWSDMTYPEGIGELIQSYSRRTLTFGNDGLNAIRALMNEWSLSNPCCWSYWGIPIVHHVSANPMDTLNMAFTRVLRWFCSGTNASSTRSEFPSWSWVKSRSEVVSPDTLALKDPTPYKHRRKPHGMEVFIEKLDGNLVDLHEFVAEGGPDFPEHMWTHRLHLNCWVAKIGPVFERTYDAFSKKPTREWREPKDMWAYVPDLTYVDSDLGRSGIQQPGNPSIYVPMRNKKTGQEWQCPFYPDNRQDRKTDQRSEVFDQDLSQFVILEDWASSRHGLVIETRDGIIRRVGILILDPAPEYKDGYPTEESIEISFATDLEDCLDLKWKKIRLS
ncbi:hypothetical protein VTL71DRAFT_23 [Oculimacula yallundae]|uniref:Heterokaryon incompatibility domain-containing protein n=1 Tax=Oculimacula yallundae TaxID=86028 RepID=A0ABR4CZZ4_9HELO